MNVKLVRTSFGINQIHDEMFNETNCPRNRLMCPM